MVNTEKLYPKRVYSTMGTGRGTRNGLNIYFEAKSTILGMEDMVKTTIEGSIRHFSIVGIEVIEGEGHEELLGYTCNETNAPRSSRSERLDLRKVRHELIICDEEEIRSVKRSSCMC